MKAIDDLCKKVMQVTDNQLNEAERTALEQIGSIHPLKMGKAKKIHATGKHNLAVVAKLRELRDTILEGEVDNK